jgi:hypothetical protein
MNEALILRRTVVSVVAPCSASGKTLFVTHVLRHLGKLGCLKISPVRDRHAEASDPCITGGRGFLLEDHSGLGIHGKDTALYLEAGAAQVEWLRHRGRGLEAGLRAAIDRFPPTMPVIIESSSAVRLLNPVCVILVVRPPIREMKPSTGAILPLVTDLMVNSAYGGPPLDKETARLRREFPSLHPQFVWSADLAREEPQAGLLLRLQRLIASSTQKQEPA